MRRTYALGAGETPRILPCGVKPPGCVTVLGRKPLSAPVSGRCPRLGCFALTSWFGTRFQIHFGPLPWQVISPKGLIGGGPLEFVIRGLPWIKMELFVPSENDYRFRGRCARKPSRSEEHTSELQ